MRTGFHLRELHLNSAVPKQSKARMGRRVVLFPLPLQGHLNPMFQLADILHSRGFSISILHTNYNAPLNLAAAHPTFTFHPIDDALTPLEVSAMSEDIMSFFNTLNAKCEAPIRDCLSRIMKEEAPSCLITDSFWFVAHDVADSLRLPRLALRTPSASATLASASLQHLTEKGYLPITEDSELEKPIPELPPLKLKDLPTMGKTDPQLLREFVSRQFQGVKGSQGLILNTFEELEGPELAKLRGEFGIPIFTIGPFHKLVPPSLSSLLTPDNSCISWLNAQAPSSVLYVSFGSLVKISEAEFLEVAWGMVNSERAFLWVVRPGMVRGMERFTGFEGELEEKIKRRGVIIDWAPQQEVLAHPAIGGFWTHSGWNSTLESICEGVPMICLPVFADQTINARYVSDVWGVGVALENGLKGKEVEKAVRRLMGEKEGEETSKKERTVSLKEKAKLCLMEGGSSHTSLQALADLILSF